MMRLRIDFSKTDAMRFCGHLDLFRTWERTFRRAAIRLSYTQGFKHHPRINIASALPLGFTSSDEVMDVWLDGDISIEEISRSLNQTLPAGLLINQISSVDISAPSLQSTLVGSEYLATFLDDVIDLEGRVATLLNQTAIPIERRGKTVDIRPYIYTITLYPNDNVGRQQLFLFLSTTQEKNARPDEVIKALGLDPTGVLFHRQKLIFHSNSQP
ncbi:MAG: TIGR03936 family radical SAM-associated protein [Anaerolineales bacterium]